MIEIKNLSFSYGNTPFIEDLNLSLENGTLTALIGENGSGKSTFLKLIAGTESPTAGNVILDGKDIRKTPAADRAKRLSYFPQSRPIPDMSALETAVMGRYPYTRGKFRTPKEDIRIAEKAMERMGISHFSERNMQTLSFGERQKVYLAMLLAQDAPNCLFDEPTNFMDISAKFSMLETLLSMKAEGKCILCVLHDISLAMQYADRIIVMKNGSVFADGTPDALFENGAVANAFGVCIERYGKTFAVLPKRELSIK